MKNGTAWANTDGAHAIAAGDYSEANANAPGAKAYTNADTDWDDPGLWNWRDPEPPKDVVANALVAGSEAYVGPYGTGYAKAPGAIAIEDGGCAYVVFNSGGKVINNQDYQHIKTYMDILNDSTQSGDAHANAAFMIGMKFYQGEGVTQSDSLTEIFLQRAHELNHQNAALELGNSYMARNHLRKDPKEALKWYKQVPTTSPNYAKSLTLIRQCQKPSVMSQWFAEWSSPAAATSQISGRQEGLIN